MYYIDPNINPMVRRELRDYLDEMSRNEDRPIRVLQGGWGIVAPDEWTQHEADVCEVTLYYANERGITIHDSSMLSTSEHSGSDGILPGEMFEDGERHNDANAHLMAEPGEHSGTVPFSCGDFVVGEYTERNIWLRFSLQYSYDHAWNWEAVLGHALRGCVNQEILDTLALEAQEAGSRRAQAYLENIPTRQTETLRQEIAYLERINSDYSTTIASNTAQLHGKRDQLMSITAMAESLQDTASREWALVQQHPRVMIADFVGENTMRLVTDDIILHYPNLPDDERSGTTRWLGPFEIHVDLHTYEVRFKNQHTRMQGRDHPHVSNGRPCFGGSEASVASLLGEGQLYAFVELCFQYLSTFNPHDDYGAYAAYWFEREDRDPAEARAQSQQLTQSRGFDNG